MSSLTDREWLAMRAIVLGFVLLLTLPSTGDLGLTWDEPAYRYSQEYSGQWWRSLLGIRSWSDLTHAFDADTLLYYWPYGRFGVNFHPPLAGQLNLLTKSMFGWFMQDYPARRVASVIEYSAAITLLFAFMSKRYGLWVGSVSGLSLLLMPRVFADGHIAGTDMPGMLLWGLTAIAFWKGVNEESSRSWRVAVGVLVGLGFVEKMAAILVVVPILLWLLFARLPKLIRRGSKWDWADGAIMLGLMGLPLLVALYEILRLKALLPAPNRIDLFSTKPATSIPGAILMVPLLFWVCRRVLSRVLPNSPLWGVDRPSLEILTSIMAFGAFVSWVGNPAWWRETMPRLAHYYMLNTARRGALPDIRILYFKQIYEYSLPWANAFVLAAITVPAGILGLSLVGMISSFRRWLYDPLPMFFLINMLTLPVMRMFSFPAHDGVRLFLPTFFFMAAMAGWGMIWVADSLSVLYRTRPSSSSELGLQAPRLAIAILALLPAFMQLNSVHPFELSYYNELIDGPANAWRQGFELTYWYDAFDDEAIAEVNRRLPPGAVVSYSTEWSAPVMVFQDLQSLGKLRKDINQNEPEPNTIPFMWLLTHDSKATTFSRLLFSLTPWYARYADQLNGLRVMTVADPKAVGRAMALWILCHGTEGQPRVTTGDAPGYIRRFLPFLARFWGEGLSKIPTPTIYEEIFELARSNPSALRLAVERYSKRQGIYEPIDVRVAAVIDRPGARPQRDMIMASSPQSLREAAEIIITRPADVRLVMTNSAYLDPGLINGFLDAVPLSASDPTVK